MEKTTIKNIETGISKECDIIYKNKSRLELVIEGTTIKLTLIKDNPLDKYYKGKFSNMEFISLGNNG